MLNFKSDGKYLTDEMQNFIRIGDYIEDENGKFEQISPTHIILDAEPQEYVNYPGGFEYHRFNCFKNCKAIWRRCYINEKIPLVYRFTEKTDIMIPIIRLENGEFVFTPIVKFINE